MITSIIVCHYEPGGTGEFSLSHTGNRVAYYAVLSVGSEYFLETGNFSRETGLQTIAVTVLLTLC